MVADTEARYSPETYWPSHPRDLEPGDDPAQPATDLYFSAAGTTQEHSDLGLVALELVGGLALGVLLPLAGH